MHGVVLLLVGVAVMLFRFLGARVICGKYVVVVKMRVADWPAKIHFFGVFNE